MAMALPHGDITECPGVYMEIEDLESIMNQLSKEGYAYRYECIFDRSYFHLSPLPYEKLSGAGWKIRADFLTEKVTDIFLVFENGKKTTAVLKADAAGIKMYCNGAPEYGGRKRDSRKFQPEDRIRAWQICYMGEKCRDRGCRKITFPEPFFLELLSKHELLDGNELPWRIFWDPVCMEPSYSAARMCGEDTQTAAYAQGQRIVRVQHEKSMPYDDRERARMEHVGRILEEEGYSPAGEDGKSGKVRRAYRKDGSSFVVIVNEYPDGFHSIQYVYAGQDASALEEDGWRYAEAEKWIADLLTGMWEMYDENGMLTSGMVQRLEIARRRSAEVYRFCLQEMLVWASGKNDRSTFMALLEMAEDMGIGNYAEKNSSCDFMCYDFPYKAWSFNRSRLISQKPEYVWEILKRFPDHFRQMTGPRMYGQGERMVQTDMPEMCLAVAFGTPGLVEFLLEKGMFGDGLAVRKEKTLRDQENRQEWYITDVLTAALRAEQYSPEKTELILNAFPSLPPAEAMVEALLSAGNRAFDMVCEKRPDLFGKIDSARLYGSGNYPAGMKKERLQRLRELYAAHYGKTGTWGFYELMLERADSQEERRKFLYLMYQEICLSVKANSLGVWILYGGTRETQEWFALFMKYQECIHDFTGYLDYEFAGPDWSSSYRIGFHILHRVYQKRQGQRLPFDLYTLSPKYRSLRLGRKSLINFLHWMKPLRILDQSDVILEKIIHLDNREYLNQAMDAGFITPVNVKYVIRGLKGKKTPSELEVKLMSLIQQDPMGSRDLTEDDRISKENGNGMESVKRCESLYGEDREEAD